GHDERRQVDPWSVLAPHGQHPAAAQRRCDLGSRPDPRLPLVPGGGLPMTFTRRRLEREEAGFTLIEMLVAMTLFGSLLAILGTVVMTVSNSAVHNRQYNDINAEARTALNRMTRELREAQAIVAVTNPYGSAA